MGKQVVDLGESRLQRLRILLRFLEQFHWQVLRFRLHRHRRLRFHYLLAFDPSKSIEENQERMTAALSDVVSGSVTTAVRDTTIDGLEIHENDNLGMVDGKILVSNPDMHQTLTETLKHMLDEDSEIVTFYVGEDGSEELANEIAQEIAEEFEDVEVEIHQGQQPVYPYLFSVE